MKSLAIRSVDLNYFKKSVLFFFKYDQKNTNDFNTHDFKPFPYFPINSKFFKVLLFEAPNINVSPHSSGSIPEPLSRKHSI